MPKLGYAQNLVALLHGVATRLIASGGIEDMPEPMPAHYDPPRGLRTRNMTLMREAYIYAWSHLTRKGVASGDANRYRRWVAGSYARQRDERGWMEDEQSCATPHLEMHCAAAGVAHLVALQLGHEDVLAGTSWWWRAARWVARECSDSTGLVIVPGTRAKGKLPQWRALTHLRRLECGLPDPLLRPEKRLVRDRQMTGWLVARHHKQERGHPIGEAGWCTEEPPLLLHPMTVERHGDDAYTAWIDRNPGSMRGIKLREIVTRVERESGRVRLTRGWGLEVEEIAIQGAEQPERPERAERRTPRRRRRVQA